MRLAKAALLGACTCIAAPAANAQDRAPSRQADTPAPRIAFADTLVVAQQASTVPSVDANAPDQIGSVVILGNEAIEDARYQEVIEGYFGEPRTEEVLARLTNELAELAREEGFAYARANIAEGGNALGMIQVQVDEGRIDEILIEGFGNAQAERILARLVGGPVRQADLESALLLVSDIPSVRLRDAKLRREGGRGILVVKLAEQEGRIRLEADNYGSTSFGPLRARASIVQNGLVGSSDQLRAALRINPVDPDELLFLSASYTTQLSPSGTTLGVDGSVGRTAPGGQLEGSDVSGDSIRGGIGLTVPLFRGKDASLWLEGRAAYITIEQDDLGAMLRDDTVVTAALGLRTQFAVAGGRARAGVSHVRGLDILGATRRGDAFASRSDGDGVFAKWEFWGDVRVPIARRLDFYASVGGQLADRPLLASEEIALGGAYRNRGYDFSEVLGDEGVHGLAELRYSFATKDIPLDFLQLYAFVDGGYVSDIASSGSEGSLFSAGPGVRARIGQVDFEVESGFPLGGSGERRTGNDPEINIRAGINF